MKILTEIALTNFAKVFGSCGFDTALLSPNIPAFDAFDSFTPDVYIGTMSSLNSAIVKNIKQRPALRTVIVADSPINENYKELLNNSPPNLVYSNNTEEYYTKTLPFENYADPFLYSNALRKNKYKCDIIAIEDNIEPKLSQFHFGADYDFKIFSNSVVKHSNFCGFIQESNKKDAYKSARVALCKKENMPNAWLAGTYAMDIETETASTVIEKLNENLEPEIKRMQRHILETATSFHFCITMFKGLGMDLESNIILNKLKEIL